MGTVVQWAAVTWPYAAVAAGYGCTVLALAALRGRFRMLRENSRY